MNGTQAKVCLFVAIFKFKVALLDRVTQTVQTRLRSDRDYNTTIGSVRGYKQVGDERRFKYVRYSRYVLRSATPVPKSTYMYYFAFLLIKRQFQQLSSCF